MVPWSTLIDEFGPKVYRTALRIVGQAADAEDVVQEVFLEIHRLWLAREPANWEAVLRSLAIRRAIDLLRRRKAAENLPEEVLDRRNTSPEDFACERELQQQIRWTVAKMPQQQAEVFSLFYFENQSHGEIAAALGTNTRAVATSLHKARLRLEAELQILLSPGGP